MFEGDLFEGVNASGCRSPPQGVDDHAPSRLGHQLRMTLYESSKSMCKFPPVLLLRLRLRLPFNLLLLLVERLHVQVQNSHLRTEARCSQSGGPLLPCLRYPLQPNAPGSGFVRCFVLKHSDAFMDYRAGLQA